MEDKCTWTAETPEQAENYKWYAECLKKYQAENPRVVMQCYEEFGDGVHGYKPSDCGYHFCPYCGKEIKEVGE